MRRLSIKSSMALVGEELQPIKDAVIDVSDGEVTGIGRVPGSNNVVDLGNTLLMPQLTNAHIHVLDYFLMGLFNKYYIDDVVGAPYGLKYYYLRRAKPESLRGGLATVFRRIRNYGVGCLLTIIEYGRVFADVVIEEAGRAGLCIVPLTEPSTFRIYVKPDDEEDVDEVFEDEVKYFVDRGFGISLISPLNYTMAELRLASRLGGSRGLPISTHVSETEDTYLDNDLDRALNTLVTGNTVFVHLTQLSDEDFSRIPTLPVVTCPRSNIEFVGKLARVGAMVRRGLRPLVGTDNVALIEPNPWDEIKVMRLLMGSELSSQTILKMVTSWAWSWGFGYVIREGEPMRGIALRIDYEGLSMDYVYDYITMRISNRDVTYIINGSSIISVS
ncbi:amidohydrolase family protein [Vulcanisaeta distributa]|uniref:Amidohydrolase n=1 Tax=Vulcanisaeta distributa (strain DSM 14429 / JCM 11212 / NBRC 100878 / IC-017) TaxID=572478 RepID=E1QQ38_VULDI|nr:amidohydrolase family protein [Vulcanisaeta distributa]ADN50410.1 amidohydrolase [Vulcanisaeta distributa DSM 14429]